MTSAAVLDELIGRLARLPAEEKKAAVADVARATAGMKWVPSPGPQTEAYLSRADVLLYGGQGGGGKSDLGLGLAFTAHKRSLVLRRQYTDLGALIERALSINGSREGFNGSPRPKLTTADDRLIRFGANQRLGDEQTWQGQPFDLKVFDEAVQFLELQVRFHLGWLRSAQTELDVKAPQKTRAVLASNPPLDAAGQWVIGMFRPWLDITHPKPAKHGALRWFVTDPDGKDFEVDGPEPHLFPGADRAVLPMSRTFISASLADNPYLINTGYQAQLDALPEPLRSAVRDGNFMAARTDALDQVIPTAWVIEAQKRWTDKPPPGVPMCSMGVDMSGGGTDPMIAAPRFDGWFAPLIEVPGKDIPVERIGKFCAGIIVSHRKDGATVVVDMGGGYGGAVFETLKENGIEVVGYKGASASVRRTADRQLAFANKRSEAIWRFREALDPSQAGGSPIALPPDPMLIADLTAPTWKPISHKGGMAIRVEPKEDVCDRLGRSTDRGDAVVMGWTEGQKAITHGQDWKAKQVGRPGGRAPQVIMGRSAAARRR